MIQLDLENRLFAYCTLGPPSGLYEGGYQEMTCETRGFWHTHIFHWCSIYVEFYRLSLVLGWSIVLNRRIVWTLRFWRCRFVGGDESCVACA